MGYGTDGLTFNTLRGANRARLPQFRDARGRLVHKDSDGSDWLLSQWCNAVCGELGEAANLIKKIERGDLSLDEARDMLSDELADVATYLDLLANRARINLGEAIIDKFNRVSERVSSQVRLNADDWYYVKRPDSNDKR